MATTLRYDVAEGLRDALHSWGFDFCELTRFTLSVRPRAAYGPAYRTRRTWRAVIRLPGHAAGAYYLWDMLGHVAAGSLDGARAARSAGLLRYRLGAALGLPADVRVDPPELGPAPPSRRAEEKAFVSGIGDDPGNLTAWLAYADWLEECGMSGRSAAVRRWADHDVTYRFRNGTVTTEAAHVRVKS